MNIQWYPGHMTKTRRQMEADLKLVDSVAELIDARVPVSSRNPDIDAICSGKPRLIVLNRSDQADPARNKSWTAHFKAQGWSVLETDARSGQGVGQFSSAARGALREQIAKWREKGQVGRPVRAMVVGVPNVGKSTFINKVAKKKSAKASDRPGVTRGKQWVHVDQGLDLLDTPGILWPKFEDELTGMNLAFTGAVKGSVTSTLNICAFVVFFYVLADPLASLGPRLGPALVGVTELFSLTPLLTADRFGFVLAAGCAGWGGLSVLCQTAAVFFKPVPCI